MSDKHKDALDLDKLEALARAATPGPWEATHQTDDECSHAGYFIEAVGKTISDDGTAPDDKDALFIAEAHPATVLQLIAKIRASEGQAQTSAAVDGIQLAAIQGLIAVTNAAYHLMDNTEESGPVGDSVFTHQEDDNDYLNEAFNLLDALPDDQPGYVMGPCAKAEWALREILAAQLADKTDAGAAESHPDDLAVQAFADAMKAKMAKSRAKGRGGWQECHAEDLRQMMANHFAKGDPVDVGNFAMMLWNRGESTAAQQSTAGGAVPEGYALVPLRMSDAMARAGGDMSDRQYADMLAAAPLMQVQPSEALEAGPFTLEQRMPSKGVEVLVYWPCSDGTFACAVDEWDDIYEDPIGMGGPTICVGEGWSHYENVTHWAPIPQPSVAQAVADTTGEVHRS